MAPIYRSSAPPKVGFSTTRLHASRFSSQRLFYFAPALFAAAFPSQGLLGPAFVSGFHVEAVFLDVLDDIFLLHLTLEAPQGVLDRLAILHPDFGQNSLTLLDAVCAERSFSVITESDPRLSLNESPEHEMLGHGSEGVKMARPGTFRGRAPAKGIRRSAVRSRRISLERRCVRESKSWMLVCRGHAARKS
jgi:hypothetical protein